ncbi:MAG: FtsW/RodA/SpoVE family cell cycle protein [Paludibacter sp.]|nr:FtsW/RodA/SpoVE family cell cycle protein [Bacteroidales bacterium]MCM1068349.1 FtsW/RodA/SpoVE family cell cycle protein [Prevotella sp.]MCM1354023.1 FtsW/RodA/SpoVE family cell cycle protein [Bacteroides sp.]MCM1442135.1 FtsW/RodA/SpoVE family cell cycle protein [Muribaculum sp.]MCM1481972.1 FtsW/RodA/SpoVE family cell cycle protein [Paludibacter sp.]
MIIFNSLKNERHKYIDKTFWIIFGILIIVSVVSLFSAASQLSRDVAGKGGSIYQPIISHITFLGMGVLAAYIIQYLPSWFIRLGGYVLLIFSIVCFLLIFAGFGVSINGAERWIRIFGIQFQPSELAKLSLIIVVADLLSRIKTKEDQKKYFLITLALTVAICALIMFTNLSTTLLLGGVIVILWILARIPFRWIAAIIGGATLLLIGGYFYVENVYVRTGKELNGPLNRAETWVNRIDRMLEDKQQANTDTVRINDSNRQAVWAQAAIARGGNSPLGVLPGNSVVRNKLPQAFADYIFSIIVEETGIIGAICLCILYLSILFRACLISSRYTGYSAMLMVMGLAIMLTTQAFVSMAVAVGLGPVTGQPLPLISRGGTSVLITCVYFGIIMAVSREQNQLKAQEQQVEQESRDNVPDLEIE